MINDTLKQMEEERECTGRYCNHETSEKHYIVFEDDLNSSIIKVLQHLVEREEVNNNNFIHICESSEGQECEYSKAKQDTISYLKSEIAKLSTNIDKK